MHPEVTELWRMADGELPTMARESLARHLTECGSCRHRLRETHESARKLTHALSALDHPAPSIRAGDVIKLARDRRRRPQRVLAAAATLLFVATGAAAAIPQSPLRRLIAQWLATPAAAVSTTTTMQRTGNTPALQGARAASRLSFDPGEGAIIDITDAPVDGELRIRLVDGADVTITGSSPGTRFALTAHGLSVKPGGIGDIQLDLPRRVAVLTVQVAGHVVFAKGRAEITNAGRPDSSGTVRIRFDSQQRSVP